MEEQKFEYYEPEEINRLLKIKVEVVSKVAILFGRENNGLIGNEIDQCDILTKIPLKQPYPSLNLSQAVMLYAYSLSSLNIIDEIKRSPLVYEQEYSHLKERVLPILKHIGMNPQSKIYNRIIERFSIIGAKDVRLLHSVMNLLEKTLQSHKKI